MELFVPGLEALYLGIMTSISPCPLATNIAAISFIGNRIDKKSSVLWAGLLYSLGRMAAYLIISIVIVTSLTSVPETARFLQKYMNIIIGPFLVITGLFLLDIIKLSKNGFSGLAKKAQDKAKKGGIWTAALLGFVFALTFCPVSAGLFFSNIMNSVKNDSLIYMPVIYGIGTALPVIVFAFVLGFGANQLGKVFNAVSKFEKWAQRITGIVFICLGIYLSYEYLIN